MFLHFLSKWCFALINIVRENFSPPIVALSLVLGMYFGFTPMLTAQWFFIAVVTVLVRTNIMMVLVSTLICAGLAQPLEPLFDKLGMVILTQTPFLLPFWS